MWFRLWELLSEVVLAQSVSWSNSQNVGQGCSRVKTWLRLRDPRPGSFTPMARVLVLPAGRRLWVLTIWTFPWVWLIVLNIWQLSSPRDHHRWSKKSRWKCNVFHDIALKVTYHHFCSILFIAQISPIYYEWGWIRTSVGSQLETWWP